MGHKAKRTKKTVTVTLGGKRMECHIVRPKKKRAYGVCHLPPKKRKAKRPYRVTRYGGAKARARQTRYNAQRKRFGHELDGR